MVNKNIIDLSILASAKSLINHFSNGKLGYSLILLDKHNGTRPGNDLVMR